MRRIARLLALLAMGWIAAWLLPGLAVGDPTVLLRPRPPETLRLLYLGALYAWLLGATAWCWFRFGPASPSLVPLRARLFAEGLGIGLGGAVLHRALLAAGGWWTPPHPGAEEVALALLTAPLLALAEEVLFRGYLFGVLREERGRAAAYVLSSALFAGVHLFRPGTAEFKLAWGVGLFLLGVVLCRATELTGSLWPAIGLHTGMILLVVLDPPGRVVPGWIPGLAGDPAAGLLGWALLAGLWGLLPRLSAPERREDPAPAEGPRASGPGPGDPAPAPPPQAREGSTKDGLP